MRHKIHLSFLSSVYCAVDARLTLIKIKLGSGKHHCGAQLIAWSDYSAKFTAIHMPLNACHIHQQVSLLIQPFILLREWAKILENSPASSWIHPFHPQVSLVLVLICILPLILLVTLHAFNMEARMLFTMVLAVWWSIQWHNCILFHLWPLQLSLIGFSFLWINSVNFPE